MFNKVCDTEEIDASMTKQDNMSPLPFDNRDTQTEIITAEERDT